MNLEELEATVGMSVRLTERYRTARMNSYYGSTYALDPTMVFRVTRVYRDTVIIRGFVSGEEMSFQIPRRLLTPTDPNPQSQRKLGTKPDDTPEMTYIAIDDPRVQWMWDDLGTYADGQSWCSQYDTLAIRMGIPPRPTLHNVTTTLNGITFTTTVRARSFAEAEALVAAALVPQTPPANG